MNASLSASTERSSLLTLNKSTLIVWVTISLLVVETFSGALRFYLDGAGLASALYLPKAACVVFFVFELLTLKVNRGFWLAILLLFISGVLGMLNHARMNNVAFALFMYSPLLFGMVCGPHLQHRQRLLSWAIFGCLVMSILGILLDKYTSVPWKGYSYSIGETQLTGNTAWSDSGTDRLAGFSRLSTTGAMMMAMFALYLAAFCRSRLMVLGLFALTFGAIYMTTNKSTAGAFILSVMLLLALPYRLPSRVVFIVVVCMGIALPIMGLTMDFDPLAAAGSSDGALASFYDRLVNTWPKIAQNVFSQNWEIFGGGFGTMGGPVALFPIYEIKASSVSDNGAVYLWAMFGVFGLALYLMLIPLLSKLRDMADPVARALLTISFCIVLISWTTDVLEVSIAALFLGISISKVLLNRAMPTRMADDLRETRIDDTTFKNAHHAA